MYKRTLATFIATLLIPLGLAQDEPSGPSQGTYTDAKTGIAFTTWTTPTEGGSNFTFGIALPANAATVNATEYIGLLKCQTGAANGTVGPGGWCGVSHAGHMTNDLLVMAWPYKDTVLSSLRWASDYFEPGVFAEGGAAATTVSAAVQGKDYQLIYRCQNCFSWTQRDTNETESVATVDGHMMVGYAVAATPVRNPGCPAKISFDFHQDGFGQWMAQLGNASSPSYSKWAALATKNGSDSC